MDNKDKLLILHKSCTAIMLTLSLLVTSSQAYGQSNAKPAEKATQDLSGDKLELPTLKIESAVDPRITQSYEIIDDIKSRNPPDNFRAEVRSGLLQVFTNSPDSVELNRLKTLPFIAIESTVQATDNIGLEIRGYYARNFLFPTTPGSPNKSNAYQMSYDAGIKYRFILDATQIDDNVSLKLLYHNTTNNFILANQNTIFMKSYQGVVAGVERSIPVTPKIGILASLDLNFISQAKSDSNEEFINQGIGFQMRGNCYYRTDWFGVASRIGAAYWQGGFVNRFTPGSQSNTGRTSHVQTFRAVSLSYVMHY